MFRVMRICALLTASRLWILAANDGPIAKRVVHEPTIAANIRVNVNMVLVPVSVMDAYGRSVTGLQRENFRVFDSSQQCSDRYFRASGSAHHRGADIRLQRQHAGKVSDCPRSAAGVIPGNAR